jgi:hypothetical protein
VTWLVTAATALADASSGEKVRHRLSLAGNRKLDYALHMIAIRQARSEARGGAFYRKKMAGGKSRKVALGVLSGASRLREPHGRFADAFARRRLTKWSPEGCREPVGEGISAIVARRDGIWLVVFWETGEEIAPKEGDDALR